MKWGVRRTPRELGYGVSAISRNSRERSDYAKGRIETEKKNISRKNERKFEKASNKYSKAVDKGKVTDSVKEKYDRSKNEYEITKKHIDTAAAKGAKHKELKTMAVKDAASLLASYGGMSAVSNAIGTSAFHSTISSLAANAGITSAAGVAGMTGSIAGVATGMAWLAGAGLIANAGYRSYQHIRNVSAINKEQKKKY